METCIKLVETADEITQVLRARYRVYVEECGYAPPSADGLLGDAFDGLARTGNVIVVRDGRVLAGGRMVIGLGEPLPLDGRYDFTPHLPASPARIAEGNYFFADPALRGTRWPLRVLRTCVQWAFERGARYGVVIAAPRARRLLEAVGFVQVAPDYVEAATGLPCVPMQVDLQKQIGARPAARAQLELRA